MSNLRNLQVHQNCLLFFVDETGHEDFADPNYPVFGLGGCAVMARDLAAVVGDPWKALKAAHFGGANVPLHAAGLRDPTAEQLSALNAFFTAQPFGRFAVTMTKGTNLPAGYVAYNVMPSALRARFADFMGRISVAPAEIALIHEQSQRGDELVQRYFGETNAEIDGVKIPVHHTFMPKLVGDPAMEVADFVVQAAGRQTLNWHRGHRGFRQDFRAIFHANPAWSSFHGITNVEVSKSDADKQQEVTAVVAGLNPPATTQGR